MFKLDKVSKRKKVIYIIAILLVMLIISVIIFSHKEIEKTIVSKTNLKKQKEYEATVTVDGITWYYEVNNEGNAINVKPKDKSSIQGSIRIPNELDGNKVISLSSQSFRGCNGLTSIEIPEGVKSIEFGLFDYCTNLISVTIPEGVTSIESCAFMNCSKLTGLTIPEGVVKIGSQAFQGCEKIESISIPSSVISIEFQAFQSCNSLTSVTILEGVISIGNSAFSHCRGLTSIIIPSSVTSIGDYVFRECNSLNNIIIDENNNNFCLEDDIVYTKDKNRIIKCLPEKEGNIIIPESIKNIDSYAFENCASLISMTIPVGITSIKEGVFHNCSGLTYIKIPNSLTSIEGHAFEGCSNLTEIEIPEGVTSIGSSAFSGCSSLTSIEILEGVTSIGSNAFKGCSNLTSIEIPEGVTSIQSSTFSNCSGLTSVTIPAGVTNIWDSAFRGCTGLTRIEIPSSVTSIASQAFYGCSNLTEIEIPEGITNIESGTFSNCSSLTEIEIPESVTNIKRDAFFNCSSLTKIIIPGSVTSIGDYVFYGCDNLIIYTASECVADYARNKNIEYVLDTTAPSIQIEGQSNTWTNGDIALNITDTQTGVKSVKINNNMITENNGEYRYTLLQNGTYIVVAKDKVGNTKTKTVQINNIDKAKPQITIGEYATNWTKENIVLNITATDSLSGIANVKVNGTNINMNNSQGTYNISENGTYEIIAIDNAGNTETKIIQINNIDKNAPTLEIREEKIVTGAKIEITALDNEGGVGIDKVTINGEGISLTNNKGEYNIKEEGEYEIIATDRLGNSTTKTYRYSRIDLIVEGNPEEWTKEDVILTITARKGGENINNVTVNGTRINMINGQGEYTVRKNGTYEIVATYDAENINRVTIEVNKIDKVAPIISGISKELENGQVKLTVNTEENGSGIEGYSWDNGVTWINTNEYQVSEIGTYTVKVKDRAGNITEGRVTVSTISGNEPPYFEIEGYEKTEEGNKVYVSGISNNTSIRAYKKSIKTDVEYIIKNKRGDIVENESEVITTGMKIIVNEKEYILAVKADLNGDGAMDISDLSILARYVVGKGELAKEYKIAGDVNNDKVIDISDISIIARALTKNISL